MKTVNFSRLGLIRASAFVLACGLGVNSYEAAAATVTVQPNAGVQKTNTLSIAAGSLLDMTNNPLIVQTTPHATVYGYAASGYNGGGWDGTSGIISATAATDPLTLTYGIIDNADGFAGLATWFGVAVAPAASLGRYTYSGDVNLDGLVDSTDYFFVDIALGNPATSRLGGDLNFDGLVDSTDYFFIDITLGSPAFPAPLVGDGKSSGSVVPEPTSVGLLGLGALGLLARRRRSATK